MSTNACVEKFTLLKHYPIWSLIRGTFGAQAVRIFSHQDCLLPFVTIATAEIAVCQDPQSINPIGPECPVSKTDKMGDCHGVGLYFKKIRARPVPLWLYAWKAQGVIEMILGILTTQL
jgi:hypothetical protein